MFIKRVRVSEPYFKSGLHVRFFFKGLRILLWRLRAVAGARGSALLQTGRVQLASDDCVLDADVLHAPSAEHHDRVLLQVMPLAGDICGHFHAVGEADASDFTNGGVRLTRSLGSHLRTHSSFERRWIKSRAILKRIKTASERRLTRLRRFILTSSLRELVDCGHSDLENPQARDKCTIYKYCSKCKLKVRAVRDTGQMSTALPEQPVLVFSPVEEEGETEVLELESVELLPEDSAEAAPSSPA